MLFVTCELWQKTGGENNTQIDCVLWTDDVTIMPSSSKNFLCMFKIKFPTKRIFRIFPILRINGMAPFCNLFMERPSYNCSTADKISTGTPASRGPSATAGLLVYCMCVCMYATSESGSGESGCATAQLCEISMLLEGLQSESVALREVSIQVWHCRVLFTYSFESWNWQRE